VDSSRVSGAGLELWGGIECTVNRVHDRIVDQLDLSGHAARADDIDRIAALGIRTLRYPLLWERCAPRRPDEISWSWSDERMARLADCGMTPIAGLLHHGSGPHYTSLPDPSFPALLSEYARAVAVRYPQLRYVTPVNEPLTTARFSGLYGHWYPHQRSGEAFARMILNQVIAVREAMRAMREVIPGIQLVQTEDCGRVYSTTELEYQAEYENIRRWLTFDLLCGRVDRSHPLWRDLAVDGCAVAQLELLLADPCPPDIVGINYYVTSDRFLDHRVHLHDRRRVGGNGRDRYADIEAARVLGDGITGHRAVLRSAWERYRLPVALTEVHLGCTREHQMRWLTEAWRGACEARAEGCDIRAVTAWALYGSFGWDSLVTRPPFEYECGAFDVTGREPRPTAIAAVIRDIVSTGDCAHPPATEPGWWRTPERLIVEPWPTRPSGLDGNGTGSRPILVTGGRGTLGSAFARVCRERGLEVRTLPRSILDIAEPAAVRETIETLRPWAVINAAGFVRVDDAETERALCYRTNTAGVSVLAAECARAGIPLVTFSSDLVFDGAKLAPYVESDPVAPLNTYGWSKAAAERAAFEAHDNVLLVRTSAFFGPWDEFNFISMALHTLARGLPFDADADAVVSPTYVPDLVSAALDLMLDGERGIWHLANRGEIAWSELAREVAARAGYSTELVRATSAPRPARQPRYSVLGTERSSILPPLNDALDRWFSEATLPEMRTVTA
jgi:dTDP-4-dehydrorhamnose reductase